MMSYKMKITKAGQMSVPAPIRQRWNTPNIRIEDKGDSFVAWPVPVDPVEAVYGILEDRAKISSTEARRQFREEERSAEERKYGKMTDAKKKRKKE